MLMHCGSPTAVSAGLLSPVASSSVTASSVKYSFVIMSLLWNGNFCKTTQKNISRGRYSTSPVWVLWIDGLEGCLFVLFCLLFLKKLNFWIIKRDDRNYKNDGCFSFRFASGALQAIINPLLQQSIQYGCLLFYSSWQIEASLTSRFHWTKSKCFLLFISRFSI